MNISHPSSKSFLRWSIWLLALAFYFYEYLLRVLPAVMEESLIFAFDINASTVGLISGLYFYLYAPMQLPVGILLDRFGAPILLIIATFICGIGGILFGVTDTLWVLGLSRLIIGFGSAFAFVSMLYTTSHLFAAHRVALLIGIANSVAIIGAFSGEGPLSLAQGFFGWRPTVVGLGVYGILLSLLILLVVFFSPRELKANAHRTTTLRSTLAGFFEVVRLGQSWINALIGFLIYLTTTAFAALWGVPFLQNTHLIPHTQASFATSMIYVGWFVGGPLVGWLAGKIRRKNLIHIGCALALVSILPVIYIQALPLPLVFIFLGLVGLFSSVELLCFRNAIDFFAQRSTGSALAFTNFIIMLGGALFQPLVGLLLDHFWDGTLHEGLKVYSFADYRLAMTCFPISFLLAFLLTFFLKIPKK